MYSDMHPPMENHTIQFHCPKNSFLKGFPDGSDGKESACNTGDLGLIPGLGRSAGEGNGNLLQYSCLENLMDGGTWQATAHGVAKSRTGLSDFTFTFALYLNKLEWKFQEGEVYLRK